MKKSNDGDVLTNGRISAISRIYSLQIIYFLKNPIAEQTYRFPMEMYL